MGQAEGPARAEPGKGPWTRGLNKPTSVLFFEAFRACGRSAADYRRKSKIKQLR